MGTKIAVPEILLNTRDLSSSKAGYSSDGVTSETISQYICVHGSVDRYRNNTLRDRAINTGIWLHMTYQTTRGHSLQGHEMKILQGDGHLKYIKPLSKLFNIKHKKHERPEKYRFVINSHEDS
jgi:hypothetical protein